MLYEGYKARIEHGGKLSQRIEIHSGIRQGCILSPTLFLITMDWIIRKVADGKTGITWNIYTQLEDLEYADDISLLTENIGNMQKKLVKLTEVAESTGLRMNLEKKF